MQGNLKFATDICRAYAEVCTPGSIAVTDCCIALESRASQTKFAKFKKTKCLLSLIKCLFFIVFLTKACERYNTVKTVNKLRFVYEMCRPEQVK